MGHRQGEGLGEFPDGAQTAFLAVLLAEDLLLRHRKERQPLPWRTRYPAGPIHPMEEAAADLVLLPHQGHGLVLVQGRAARSAAFGVGRQGGLELVRNPQVVHNEPAGLVAEDAIDPGNGLHQPVAAHGFVQVHGVKIRRIEAGQPHVADQDDPEGVLGIAEPLGQGLAPRLVPDMALPVCRIGRRSGHDHLDGALLIVLIMPGRPQACQLPV